MSNNVILGGILYIIIISKKFYQVYSMEGIQNKKKKTLRGGWVVRSCKDNLLPPKHRLTCFHKSSVENPLERGSAHIFSFFCRIKIRQKFSSVFKASKF